jgi:hypothetical protein
MNSINISPIMILNKTDEHQNILSLYLVSFLVGVHVSDVSIAHHQEVQQYGYSNWYLLFFLDDNRQSSKKNNRYQLSYPYGIPPDDGL